MLGIPDYEPEMRKATKALKDAGVRHAAKGAFLLEGMYHGRKLLRKLKLKLEF